MSAARSATAAPAWTFAGATRTADRLHAARTGARERAASVAMARAGQGRHQRRRASAASSATTRSGTTWSSASRSTTTAPSFLRQRAVSLRSRGSTAAGGNTYTGRRSTGDASMRITDYRRCARCARATSIGQLPALCHGRRRGRPRRHYARTATVVGAGKSRRRICPCGCVHRPLYAVQSFSKSEAKTRRVRLRLDRPASASTSWSCRTCSCAPNTNT